MTVQAGGSFRAQATIDWSGGRVLGFACSADDTVRYERVVLRLDGVDVTSAVADRSVFEFGEAWAGLSEPAREECAFALRIPQAVLLPAQLDANAVELEVRDGRGTSLLRQRLRSPYEVLALTEGAPVDLLYEVDFGRVRDGLMRGCLRDRYRLGRAPAVLMRFNDGASQPLPLLGGMDEAGEFHFELSLPLEALNEGDNRLQLTGLEGQPLASYPIRLGMGSDSLADRRLQALEAEVRFLKQLLLTRPEEQAPARLDLLKTEMVGLCSEMLNMQRIQLEREFQAQLALLNEQGPVSRQPLA